MAKLNLTIVGHRGAAGLVAENTIPSFIRALDLGCRALELDVHRIAADNVGEKKHMDDGRIRLAVIHDETLDRTTDGTGLICEQNAEHLKSIHPPVPMLDEVIAAILDWCNHKDLPARMITLNIELKGTETAEPVSALIQDIGALQYLVSSFNLNELRDFRKLDSETPVAPLFDRWRDDCLAIAGELNAQGINLGRRIVSEARINRIKEAGYSVWVYTVNSRRSARRLEQLGVDGIFTDRPDRMLD